MKFLAFVALVAAEDKLKVGECPKDGCKDAADAKKEMGCATWKDKDDKEVKGCTTKVNCDAKKAKDADDAEKEITCTFATGAVAQLTAVAAAVAVTMTQL